MTAAVLTSTHRGQEVTLQPHYDGRGGQTVDLKDDGLVDEVAVYRAVQGRPVRLTPREVVCAVHRMAVDGLPDSEIAYRLGRPGITGTKWVRRIRSRHAIPSPPGREWAHGSRKVWAA